MQTLPAPAESSAPPERVGAITALLRAKWLRRALLGVLLALQAAWLQSWAFAKVSATAAELAQRAAFVAALVLPKSAAPEQLPPDELDAPVVEAKVSGSPKALTKHAAPTKRGVFVSASTVLRLSQHAAIPRATLVGPAGARPAGLRLVGVSALGIGMRDGDVLTRVLGVDATSPGSVIQMVLAARARRAHDISGEFWRQGERWSIVVEQPYLDAAAPSASAP